MELEKFINLLQPVTRNGFACAATRDMNKALAFMYATGSSEKITQELFEEFVGSLGFSKTDGQIEVIKFVGDILKDAKQFAHMWEGDAWKDSKILNPHFKPSY